MTWSNLLKMSFFLYAKYSEVEHDRRARTKIYARIQSFKISGDSSLAFLLLLFESCSMKYLFEYFCSFDCNIYATVAAVTFPTKFQNTNLTQKEYQRSIVSRGL